MSDPVKSYEAIKNLKFKTFPEAEAKKHHSMTIIEELEYARDHLKFCEKKDGSIDIGIRMPDSSLSEVDLILPPARTIFGNSLDGLGGQAKLPNNKLGKRKFSTDIASSDLFHKKIEKKNANLGRKPFLIAAGLFLEHLADLCILYKVRNQSAHPQAYKLALVGVKGNCTPETLKDPAALELAMFRMMYTKFHRAFLSDSPDATSYFGEPNSFEFRLSRYDMSAVKDISKQKPIDPDVMAIYKAGETDSNPDYKHAKDVVEAHASKTAPMHFERLNITNVNPKIKYGPFGPYGIGRNSTVSWRVNPAFFYGGELDGLNLYLKSGLVFKSEADTGGNAPLVSKYQMPSENKDGDDEDDEKKEEDEDVERDVEHVDKKVKISNE